MPEQHDIVRRSGERILARKWLHFNINIEI